MPEPRSSRGADGSGMSVRVCRVRRVDLWDVDALDLTAYLRRIGVSERTPSRTALDELLVAHAATFSFDNIDVLLGQHPGVDLVAVQEKFIGRGRGGYCFEHATLVGAVLERLEYVVQRQLARVGDTWTVARTHLDLMVTLPDGEIVLADPGIGRPPLGAITVQDNAELRIGGWVHRLRRRVDPEPGWLLERQHHDEWEEMHTTDEGFVRPVDVRLGHHYTSTHPLSHFVTTLTVTRHSEGAHRAVTVAEGVGALTERRPGHPTQWRALSPDEVVEAAADLTSGLTEIEIARLRVAVGAMLSPAEPPPGE